MIAVTYSNISVTMLGDFLNFPAINLSTKVAQIFGDFLSYSEASLLINYCCGKYLGFLEKVDYFLFQRLATLNHIKCLFEIVVLLAQMADVRDHKHWGPR